MSALINSRKSKKLFAITTILVIISLSSVLSAYAAMITVVSGSGIPIGGISNGAIQYIADSDAKGGWSTDFQLTKVGDSLFTRLFMDKESYSGNVIITWQLQNETSSHVWSNVGEKTSTTIWLNGTATYVYATSDGTMKDNRDWGKEILSAGCYRVTTTIESA